MIHLGQISGSRERLLKVEVTNINSKRLLLSNTKKLHLASSELLRKTYITPDLSYHEGLLQKELCSKLNQRREAGITNLIIHRGQMIKLHSP